LIAELFDDVGSAARMDEEPEDQSTNVEENNRKSDL
jgi:hypothetical protein